MNGSLSEKWYLTSSCSQQSPRAASLKTLLEMQILAPYLYQLWGTSLSNYVPVSGPGDFSICKSLKVTRL